MLLGFILGLIVAYKLFALVWWGLFGAWRHWHLALRCLSCDAPLAPWGDGRFTRPFDGPDMRFGCPYCGNLTLRQQPDGGCPAKEMPLKPEIGRYTWYGRWEWK